MDSVEERFVEIFGRESTAVASAPGRVNLIGEHTDYNEGYVLPAAIPQETVCEIAPRGDGLVRLASESVGGGPQSYELGSEEPGHGWVDYVQGLTFVLRDAGLALPGFDARIASDVPLGSGVSSSASLSIAVLRALRKVFALGIDDVALALLAKRSENEFVGAPVGVMDPMACSLCEERVALFLDTRSLHIERVPIPEAAEIVVISSGIRHSNATGDYRLRRAECERAAAELGVRSLRDLSVDDLDRITPNLPEPLARRVRHVITENDRVLRACEAMRRDDVRALGELFDASHASMRDDYEVSIAPIDRLVAIARAAPEVYGARLTGGGFGGSVVILAARGAGREVAARVSREYAASSPVTPRVLVPQTE